MINKNNVALSVIAVLLAFDISLRLASPGQARIVRAGKNGAPEVTDGPYPEAKEFLAGFWIIDCESTDRAYAIAARASAAPGKGGVPINMPIEVREVMSAPPVDM